MSRIKDLPIIEERLGTEALARRLSCQAAQEVFAEAGEKEWFHRENFYGIHSLLKGVLKMTGLYQRGNRNFKQHDVKWNIVPIEVLPAEFEGYTVLHLTDLHLDGDETIVEAIREELSKLRGGYDLCVVTGDFRFKTHGAPDRCMSLLEQLRKEISTPVYAVLGNHDCIEMVPFLEEMSIHTLLNESVRLADSVHLVGVDDPHLYRGHDFQKAFQRVPVGATRLLLAHSPEVYREAAEFGVHLMLCGHTHGGQICLPGGHPILVNARCPRSFARGPWSYCGLQGYTSVGTGGSGVPVRFHSRPEITLHTLVRQEVAV